MASNDVHYVKEEDWAPHDALLCIQTGSKIDDQNRMRYDARQFYLKSRQQMEELFKEAPESITNTFAVAEMCDLKLPFGENNYPVFTLPPEIKTKVADNVEYLKTLCIKGLKDGYDEVYQSEEERGEDTPDKVKELSERIDYELSVITKTGFNDYFLIVADFMGWAGSRKFRWVRGRVQVRVAWWLMFWELPILIRCALACFLRRFLNRNGYRLGF